MGGGLPVGVIGIVPEGQWVALAEQQAVTQALRERVVHGLLAPARTATGLLRRASGR